MALQFDPGEWVWLADPEALFIPAEVVAGFRAGEEGSFRTESGQTLQLAAADTAALLRLDPRVLSAETTDLVETSHLSEQAILHLLRRRCEHKRVYTAVSSIIIAVNPFEKPEATPESSAQSYRQAREGEEPHVYALAREAYASLRRGNGANQAVIISGESGAGKTETAKLILDFVAHASPRARSESAAADGGAAGPSGGLEAAMMESNPVLEAFGNAKTVRNNNSSRFGKLMSVGVDIVRGTVCGVHITSYLLEKSRVVAQAPGERNYHIFYALLACAGRAGHDRGAEAAGSAEPPAPAPVVAVAPVFFVAIADYAAADTDELSFEEGDIIRVVDAAVDDESAVWLQGDLGDAVSAVPVSYIERCEEQPDVDAEEVVYSESGGGGGGAAVLGEQLGHSNGPLGLLNVAATDFKFLGGEAACASIEGSDEQCWATVQHAMRTLDMSESDREGIVDILAAVLHVGNMDFVSEGADAEEHACVSDALLLQLCAKLLHVEASELETVLISRAMGANSRSSVVVVQYTAVQAADARNALAKHLYANLFDWLVHMVSTVLSPHGRSEASISVLDIFGFESFEHNSFEQLCINYCNQKLQCFFDDAVLGLEQEEYERQGIAVPRIDFEDNTPCLALLEQPRTGIFALLDEEVNLPRGSDVAFLRKVTSGHSAHGAFSVNRKLRDHFQVSHFAGQVSYDVTGMLEKNKDAVHRDISAMLSRSSSSLVQRLTDSGRATFARRSSVDGGAVRSAGKAKGKKALTLAAKFKGQLREMVEQLSTCQPHFIRCLKPNARSTPGEFDPHLMLAQIRCTGLEQVCQIRQAGYPVRMDRADLEHRLRHLSSATGADPVPLEVLLQQLERIGVLPSGVWVEGRTKVFFKSTALARLDAHEATMHDAARTLQALVRGRARRHVYRRWQALRAELSVASSQRDVEHVSALLQRCSEELPFGGKSLADVCAAQRGQELAGEEALACQRLEEVGARRDVDAIRQAIAEAEALNAQTMPTSAGSLVQPRSRLWNAIQTARNRLEATQSEEELEAAMESQNYAQIVAALAKIAPEGAVGDSDGPVAKAKALVVSLEADVISALRDAVGGRETDALEASLARAREMGLPPAAMVEAEQTLVAIEQESRNAVELEDARRKLSFSVKVCSTNDRLKLVTALSVARAAGLGPRDKVVIEVRRMVVESTLSAAGGSADKAELKAAIAEAAEVGYTGPLVAQVQSELTAILDAEQAARAKLIAQVREVVVGASEGVQPSKVIRAAIEEVETHEQRDLLLSALANEVGSIRALLVRRELQERAQEKLQGLVTGSRLLATIVSSALIPPQMPAPPPPVPAPPPSPPSPPTLLSALSASSVQVTLEPILLPAALLAPPAVPEPPPSPPITPVHITPRHLDAPPVQLPLVPPPPPSPPSPAPPSSLAPPLPPPRSPLVSMAKAPPSPPDVAHATSESPSAEASEPSVAVVEQGELFDWQRMAGKSKLEDLEAEPGADIWRAKEDLAQALEVLDQLEVVGSAELRAKAGALVGSIQAEQDCIEELQRLLTHSSPDVHEVHSALSAAAGCQLHGHPKVAQAARLQLRLLRPHCPGGDGPAMSALQVRAHDTTVFQPYTADVQGSLLLLSPVEVQLSRFERMSQRRKKAKAEAQPYCVALNSVELGLGASIDASRPPAPGLGAQVLDLMLDGQVLCSLQLEDTEECTVWIGKLRQAVEVAHRLAETGEPAALKKEGALLKQGHMVKNWKRRHVVLEGDKLAYYAGSSSTAMRLKGEIQFWRKVISVAHDESLKAPGNGNACTFKLEVGEEGGSDTVELWLCAEGPEQMHSWIDTLDSSWLDASSDSALLRAAAAGRANRVVALLKAGASANQRDAHGRSPLLHAASAGHVQCVRPLLGASAVVDAMDICGTSALMYAAQGGHIECAQLLVAAGASLSVVHPYTGRTAAMFAAAKAGISQQQVLELLLDAGLDLSQRDYFGRRLQDFPAAEKAVLARIPKLLKQPEGAQAFLGAPVRLVVHADARPAPSYAWFKDGVQLADAQAATLLISEVQPSDAGAYECEVKNNYGTIRSQVARVECLAQKHGKAASMDGAVSVLGDQSELIKKQQQRRQQTRKPSKVNMTGATASVKTWSFRSAMLKPGPGTAGSSSRSMGDSGRMLDSLTEDE